MSEEKLTSNTLEIEKNSHLPSSDNKESYKSISEDISLENVTSDTAKMVRENGADGADEKMLGSSDKEALALKDVPVKFITGSDINGDAKIEVGTAEKAFSGMTKEELMKYANDPFWVKLRWVLFIAFWALWIAMLVGAIAIIVLAPKCAAPTPLKWYEKGPLITIKDENDGDIEKFKELDVQGVIYEVPAEETYTDKADENIKKIVGKYKESGIQVIVDLTPNFVTKDFELFENASNAEVGSELLNAFAITTNPNLKGWVKIDAKNDETAFIKHGKHFFLSQFGDNIDVRMDNPLIKKEFYKVLEKLVEIGVKGFRLKNAKHFIIQDTEKAEGVRTDGNANKYSMGEYKFYDHSQSTYSVELGNLLEEYARFIHNKTNDEGFLTVTDSITGHEDKYMSRSSQIAFDLLKTSVIKELSIKTPLSSIPKRISNVFDSLADKISLSSVWMQLPFTDESYQGHEPSAFYMFISLMRGVLIAPENAFINSGISNEMIKNLREERKKDAIQFGKFEVVLAANESAIGYTRVKSGNPGSFIVYNPNDVDVVASFNSTVFNPDTSLNLFMSSSNFKSDKTKFFPTEIAMAAKSAAIFTFVPKG